MSRGQVSQEVNPAFRPLTPPLPPILRSSGARNSYSICISRGYTYPYSHVSHRVYNARCFLPSFHRSFNILQFSHLFLYFYISSTCTRDSYEPGLPPAHSSLVIHLSLRIHTSLTLNIYSSTHIRFSSERIPDDIDH